MPGAIVPDHATTPASPTAGRDTATRPRLAIVGLYNSGSSGVAAMLHHLGVDLGGPFHRDPAARGPVRHYESADLADALRAWWREPALAECASAAERVAGLAAWADRHARADGTPLAAKHPLLSLCGPDLLEAWGPGTRFIWSWRPLAQSVAGLARRGWFRGHESAIQERLWTALLALEASGADVVRIEWPQALADPPAAALRLATLAGLAPGPTALAAAAAALGPR
jgi:hypothetical protein